MSRFEAACAALHLGSKNLVIENDVIGNRCLVVFPRSHTIDSS